MRTDHRPIRISVVIPSFNHAPFLGPALASALGQVGEFDLEVWVIDGGSTDGTVELLRSYGDRIRWVSEPDGGQSDALNKGFRLASGDIIGWLNSDDLYQPGALAAVARAFRENPSVEWVHGRADVIDTDGRVCRRWVSAYKRWRCKSYSYARLLTENFIQPNSVFWRRSLTERVGGVEPSLHLAMDYDLWLRFAQSSNPLYLDAPIACFRWYPASKSGSRYVEQFREARAIARRHEPGRRLTHLCGAMKASLAISCYTVADMFGRRGKIGEPPAGNPIPPRSEPAPAPNAGAGNFLTDTVEPPR
jgi:glycosyltransferase involved in cell wall biosynthesis